MTNSSFSLITWNLHHGGGIKIARIIEALKNNPADVVVLTEFRDGENGKKIKDTLSSQGLTYQCSSVMPSATNGVLIASRYELIPLEAVSHRLVPVSIPALDLTVLGLHIPGENDKWGKKEHWEQVLSFAKKHANQRTTLLGDFNTGLAQDAEGTPFTRGEAMQSLLELGYQDAWRTKHGERREYTWYSNAENGFRLDYAFLSPALSPHLLSADHLQDVRISRISDHALLRVSFEMTFDHPEDRTYFAALLCDGDEQKLMPRFGHCFDFRDPMLKRAEFDAQKKSLMPLMIERYGRSCMLQYPKICEGSEKLLLDHFIPLSSNKLNKTLRSLSALKGKKVQTQSFGANHPDNFVLACPRCNAFKMNKIPDAELLARVTAAKSSASSSDIPLSFMSLSPSSPLSLSDRKGNDDNEN